MEEGVLAIIWLIIMTVGILITIVYWRKYTNEERISMIEKGLNPGDLAASSLVRPSRALWPLRFSLLFIGAGIGLFLGYFLDMALGMEEVAYFSMLFIFGGAGLGIAYIVEEKREKEHSSTA